jgi:hypothetical protein
MAIRPMGELQIPEVVRLHRQELRSDLVGRAGDELLTMRYRAMVEVAGACVWVDDVDGAVAGFVGLVWDESALRASIRRRFGRRFWLWALVQVVRRPQVLISARRAHGLPELRPVVVAPQARGTATTDRLFAAALAGAAERGFAEVETWVEADNEASLKAHRKRGFVDRLTIGRPVRLVAETKR